MKQVYGSINMQNGAIKLGIIKVQVAPREWIANEIVVDFATGAVINAINFYPGCNWLNLQFIPHSYEWEEKPKTTKAGDVIETTISGVLNHISPAELQKIESLRFCEFVVLAMDKKRDRRLVGNNYVGMQLRFNNKIASAAGGSNKPELQLFFESDGYSPFYII